MGRDSATSPGPMEDLWSAPPQQSAVEASSTGFRSDDDACEACEACTAADTRRTGYYIANCRGCSIRAIAGGKDYFYSAQAGQMTPAYRGLLIDLFGEDWQHGHTLVKAEVKRLAGMAG